jgi:hypothetical protein
LNRTLSLFAGATSERSENGVSHERESARSAGKPKKPRKKRIGFRSRIRTSSEAAAESRENGQAVIEENCLPHAARDLDFIDGEDSAVGFVECK